jgi:hypothetical protein
VVNVEGEGVHNHKIQGQAEVIHERMKFQLKNMLELCVVEARWFLETGGFL